MDKPTPEVAEGFGRDWSRAAQLWGLLAGLAFVGGTLLAVAIVVVREIPDTDAVWDLLALAMGAVIAPTFTIGIGLHLGRTATSVSGTASPNPA